MKSLAFALSSLLLAPPAAAEEPVTFAILGDSLSTGAATHPALTFDAMALWKVFDGKTSAIPSLADLPLDFRDRIKELTPPRRSWPTSREFFGGPDWGYRNVMQSLSRAYLDTEEYSWGYLFARALGHPATSVLIAAENGARAEAMPRQVDRILAGGRSLPRHVFVFYTGNDLCGATLGHVTTAEEYQKRLEAGFDYLLRNGDAPQDGTNVYVLSYLSVLQLLHSDAILAKKIFAFGAETTCKELREAHYLPKKKDYDPGLPPEATYFGMFMPPNPAAFCPTLFGGPFGDKDETIGALANRIREFRERQAKVVERFNAVAAARRDAPPVRFHLIAGTADLQFEADDIAGDCFHLSVLGQAKVARAVLEDFKRLAAH